MAQENTNIVRKLFELINKNDLSRLDEFDTVFSPNLKMQDPTMNGSKGGLREAKQTEANYIKAFPNKTVTIDSLLATEDQVVVRWTAKGTHKGSFQGCSPTNRDFSVSGISMYRLSKGKITEICQVWDRCSLLEQIGELKTAHALH